MKQLIFVVILFLLGTISQAQSIPWFFSTPVFQEWTEANKVEGLIATHLEFASFRDYTNYLAKLEYRNNTELSQVEAQYAFDEQGNLKTLTITRKKIEMWDSEYVLTEDDYNRLCQEFEQLPYAQPKSTLKESALVRGLEHLNIKANRHKGTLLHHDEIISAGGVLRTFSDSRTAYYWHQLLARFHFENGLLQSYEMYDLGSADTGNLPYYSKVWFDEQSESCSILKVHAYFPKWEGDWGVNSVIKDTVMSLGYYRCMEDGLVEGEVFEDSSGALIYGIPFIHARESQQERSSVIDLNVVSFRHIQSIFDTYLEELSPRSPNSSYLGWYHSAATYFSSEDGIFATPTAKGEYQLICKFDRKGNYKSEQFFEINQEKKELRWEGKKVENGYAHVRKSGQHSETITYFRTKEDGTFEVIQEKKVRKNLHKVDFRLVFEDGEIVAEENGSTNKVRYKIRYRK